MKNRPYRPIKICNSSNDRIITRRCITRWARNRHYNNIFFERTFRNEEIERLLKLKKTIESIEFDIFDDLNTTLNSFIELINVITEFYDYRPLKVITEKDLVDCFNDFLKEVIRRNSEVPIGYRNRSKPNERVTDKNLLFGDAKEVKGNAVGIIKEYNGKKYKILVKMTPIFRWRKGTVKNIENKKVMLRQSVIRSTSNNIKYELVKACDIILKKCMVSN